MKAEFSPIPLTILDFMGIFLPGLVWLILFISIPCIYEHTHYQTPIDVAIYYLKQISNSTSGTFYSVAIVLTSLLIGYIVRPIAMTIGETFSVYLFYFDKTYNKNNTWIDYKFPFPAIFKTKLYYKEIEKNVSLINSNWQEFTGKQPFDVCKRILRIKFPSIWREAERREAEVRMMGALLVASLFNLILSIASLVLFFCDTKSFSLSIIWWLLTSLFITVLLEYGFNKLRVREVGYVYLNLLIAMKLGSSPENSIV